MASLSALPSELQKRLQNELKPGETLVWVDQPIANRAARAGFVMWFFFIPWTGFSIFFTAGAAGFKAFDFGNANLYLVLFGLPFVLAGLAGLSTPIWLKRRAQSTVYAITNRRALSIEGTKSITVKTYLGTHIANIEKVEHRDGSGDLILRTDQYRDSEGDKQTLREGFTAVGDVRHVERLLDTLVRSSAAQTVR